MKRYTFRLFLAICFLLVACQPITNVSTAVPATALLPSVTSTPGALTNIPMQIG